MQPTISDAALGIVRKMQQNELTESVIYEKIAHFAKGEENKLFVGRFGIGHALQQQKPLKHAQQHQRHPR